MRRMSDEIAAKWETASVEQARRWPWDLAVKRAGLLREIDDLKRRARCEIAAIHELRQKGVT